MKCPHCGYKDGWDPENFKITEGKEGTFYQLKSYTLSRSIDFEDEETGLFGCPECKKTFID